MARPQALPRGSASGRRRRATGGTRSGLALTAGGAGQPVGRSAPVPGAPIRTVLRYAGRYSEDPMNLLCPIDRYLMVNGLRLHLLDWGGGGRPPLLLLHGFTGHAHAWDTLSIALQPHFHVYALAQRGHGDSDPADVYNAVAAFDDLGGVVDQLGLAPLVMVGLSMGGRNAMYFASKRPEAVRKL